jgi:protein SCO1/2
MKSRLTWLPLALALLCAAGAGAWVGHRLQPKPPELSAGTWLPQPRELGEFALVDHHGKAFNRASLSGQASLVFFGFTHCPDVCPSTLAMLAQTVKQPQMDPLRVVLVSVDPERDTPAALSDYLGLFDPRFVGVTGSRDQIERLTKTMGVASARVDLPGGGYTMDHSAVIFLLDDRGRMVAVFTAPFDAERIAEDVRQVASRLRG